MKISTILFALLPFMAQADDRALKTRERACGAGDERLVYVFPKGHCAMDSDPAVNCFDEAVAIVEEIKATGEYDDDRRRKLRGAAEQKERHLSSCTECIDDWGSYMLCRAYGYCRRRTEVSTSTSLEDYENSLVTEDDGDLDALVQAKESGSTDLSTEQWCTDKDASYKFNSLVQEEGEDSKAEGVDIKVQKCCGDDVFV